MGLPFVGIHKKQTPYQSGSPSSTEEEGALHPARKPCNRKDLTFFGDLCQDERPLHEMASEFPLHRWMVGLNEICYTWVTLFCFLVSFFVFPRSLFP